MDELTHEYALEGHLTKETDFVDRVTITVWGGTCCGKSSMTLPDGTCFAYTYDAMGRQTSATDAVGTTTFTYDAFGQLTSEQVNGLYSKTFTRHWDAFGRNVGYSVDGDRKQSITYDSATGRIAESDGFAWEYLSGSNLKSKLTYPNEAVVTWTYEPYRDLLTAVTNATYSTYVYTNDLLGRRTSKNDEQYGYNVRDELISADEVSYNYDDIGNRTTAEGKTYTANNLNQYTAIDDFAPQYDDDGNQTLVKTETGVWSVTYNAENRPIRWQSGDTVITMAFDRMGRRVEMCTVKDGEETLQRFVYDNYLCIQQLRGADNALFHSYVWDPSEPIATQPLVFLPASGEIAYYFHDGNKNVSDLVDVHETVVHYGYTPFGTPTSSMPSENPFGFSAEYTDDGLGLVYYNYRHYNSDDGRWLGRDRIENKNEYDFIANSSLFHVDRLGLEVVEDFDPDNPEHIQKLNHPATYMEFTLFMDWYRENEDLSWVEDLPACPCCLEKRGGAFISPGGDFSENLAYHPSEHPGATVCIRSSNWTGAGEQCCYDKFGQLITKGAGAGTPDIKTPSPVNLWLGHFNEDVKPFWWAQQLDGGNGDDYLQLYLRRRPPQNKNKCKENDGTNL